VNLALFSLRTIACSKVPPVPVSLTKRMVPASLKRTFVMRKRAGHAQ
jgi:hypothetical protein